MAGNTRFGLGFGFPLGMKTVQLGALLNYTDEYKSVLAAMIIKPSLQESYYYNRLISRLKTAGIWNKLDYFNFYAIAVNTNNEALINWINPIVKAELEGNTMPSFTPYNGFSGNKTELARINTKFIPSSAIKSTNQSASFGFLLWDNVASGDSGWYGVSSSGNAYVLLGSGAVTRLMSSDSTSYSLTNQSGYFAFTRNGTTVKSYQNKVVKETKTQAAGALPTKEFYLLAFNNNGSISSYSNNKVGAFFWGSYLDDNEIGIIQDEFEYCLDGIKHGYIPDLVMSIMGDSISGTDAVDWPVNVPTNIYIKLNHSVPGATALSGMDAIVSSASEDNADIGIFALGQNDNNAGNMAALQAEIEENIAEFKVSNPNATCYYINVLPCWTNNTGASVSDKSNIRTAIAAACASQGITCWDTMGWIEASDTLDGIHTTSAGGLKVWNKIKELI